jgi:hypothetical protein
MQEYSEVIDDMDVIKSIADCNKVVEVRKRDASNKYFRYFGEVCLGYQYNTDGFDIDEELWKDYYGSQEERG